MDRKATSVKTKTTTKMTTTTKTTTRTQLFVFDYWNCSFQASLKWVVPLLFRMNVSRPIADKIVRISRQRLVKSWWGSKSTVGWCVGSRVMRSFVWPVRWPVGDTFADMSVISLHHNEIKIGLGKFEKDKILMIDDFLSVFLSAGHAIFCFGHPKTNLWTISRRTTIRLGRKRMVMRMNMKKKVEEEEKEEEKEEE